jgi:acyl-CoA dehydrogenase
MGTLGGSLKFREKITGRFADILAWMYIATSTLRRFEADGRREQDLPFAKFVLKHALTEIQHAFDGIFDNMYGVQQKTLSGKLIFGTFKIIFKDIIGLWSRFNSIGSQASDHLQQVMCHAVLKGGDVRDHLTAGIYVPKDPKEHFAQLENAMSLSLQSEAIEKKVSHARRTKVLPKVKGEALLEAAREKGVITADEYQLVKKAAQARWEVIQVDDFSADQYHSNKVI